MSNELILELQLERLEEGGYVAVSSDLPGLVAQGRTVAEATEIARDVARKLIESYMEHGDPLPAKVRAAVRRAPRRARVSVAIGLPAEAA